MKKPLVLITWYDAKDGQTGWHSLEDIEKEKLAMCHSVGWLMFKDDKRTVVMQTIQSLKKTKKAAVTSLYQRVGLEQ